MSINGTLIQGKRQFTGPAIFQVFPNEYNDFNHEIDQQLGDVEERLRR